MDPITPGIISGLVVRALGGGAGSISRTIQTRRKRAVNQALSTLELTSKQLIMTTLATLKSQRTPQEIDGIAEFLRSPEADMAVRSVAITVISKEYDRNLLELQRLFSALLTLVGRLSSHSARECAAVLIDLISKIFRNAIGQLNKADPKVYGEVVDRAAIEKASGYLFRAPARNGRFALFKEADLVDVAHFIELYKPAIQSRTSELVPAYFDVQKRVKIDPHYVVPRFHRLANTDQLSFGQMLASSYRNVVLGDPGAGKSTLVQKLAFDFSKQQEDGHLGATVPFIVSMRSYEEAKRSKNCSLLQYIAANINENLHISTTPDVIEYVFLSGRGLVLFDGLDELLDIARRRELVAAVESFADLYASATVIVTSRSVGYDEAPLDPSAFETFRLMNFTDEDVATYATNWFAIDDQLDLGERQQVISAFLDESRSVSDLRSNALMLGLLCNVYRGIRTIPKNRADLYEKCAEMLFEKWDARRGILAPGPLKADAKSALQDVALWMYASSEYSKGVPRRALEHRLATFWKRRYETDEEARAAASSLLDLWRGRTWVLTDIGTSISKRDEVYKFTHQTFLEYFSACELVRRNPSPSKLWRKLTPRVRQGSWDIIAQLSIQKLDAAYLDAADEVVKLLLKDLTKVNIFERTNLLSFAARNLDALYIRPKTCRELVRSCVDLFLEGIPSLSAMPPFERYEAEAVDDFVERQGLTQSSLDETFDTGDNRIFGPEHVCEPLLHMVAFRGEHSRLIVDEIVEYSSKLLLSTSVDMAARAFVVLAAPGALLRLSRGYLAILEVDSERLETLAIDWNISPELRSLARSNIVAWSKTTFWAPIGAARNRVISVSEMLDTLLEEMPVPSALDCLICTSDPFPEFPSLGSPLKPVQSFAESLLRCYLGLALADGVDDETEAVRCLRKIGEVIAEQGRVSLDSSWGGRSGLEKLIVHPALLTVPDSDSFEQDLNRIEAVEIEFDDVYVVFAATVLLCYYIETEEWKIADHSRDQIAALRLGPLQALEPVLIARIEPALQFAAKDLLVKSNLPQPARDLLVLWVERRIKFAF